MKINEMRMTPAALSAAATGDYANFITAATPGGIEAQEKAGQSDLTMKFDRLPKDYLYWQGDGTWREAMERLGFEFGDDVDDIFVSITPPSGWTLRASDHSMYSYIHDDQGRKRGSVFYKAAFYDRKANFSLCTRYQGGGDYRDQERFSSARDTAKGTVLIEYGPTEDFNQSEREDRSIFEWLDDSLPDWRNVEAYW